MSVDPVTGAQLYRRSYPAYGVPAMPQYLTANPYPYQYPYIPAQVLTPSPTRRLVELPPESPALVPVDWRAAYNEYYGTSSPYRRQVALEPEASPRPQAMWLPSPHVSPYYGLVPLPVLPDESYENTQENWRQRFFNWVNGESLSEPHRHFFRPVLIHECLDKKKSGIKWNVSYPPHTILLNAAPHPDASAFEPALASVKLICPLLPWMIEIKAHSPHNYITVLSLLGDIHKMLNKQVDSKSYSRLPEEFRQQVNAAFSRRVWSIPDRDAATVAESRGIKRVDYLLDRVLYLGLHQQKNLIDTFELKLSPLPL